jgi:RecB family exonuclease
MFYPEFLVSGNVDDKGTAPSDKLIGKIDLLVIDKTGNLHIVDYKTSPKNYE